MEWTVPAEQNGKTVKQVLRGVFSLSENMIKRLKQATGGILVNDQHVTVRYVLRTGERLQLAWEDVPHQTGQIVPTPMALDIIYEDDAMIVINKPPAVPTHPSHGHYTDTLANGLAAYFARKGRPFVFRCSSRLDKNTSGVVIVAKDAPAAAALNAQHLAGQYQKCYLALLEGRLAQGSGEIDAPIARVSDSVILRNVSTQGEPARTRYRVCNVFPATSDLPPVTLVAATPVTGRTHQLRVHFAHIGHPICDDGLYGNGISRGIGRQALHAYRVSVFHPRNGKLISFIAPPPPDLQPWMTETVLQQQGIDT